MCVRRYIACRLHITLVFVLCFAFPASSTSSSLSHSHNSDSCRLYRPAETCNRGRCRPAAPSCSAATKPRLAVNVHTPTPAHTYFISPSLGKQRLCTAQRQCASVCVCVCVRLTVEWLILSDYSCINNVIFLFPNFRF